MNKVKELIKLDIDVSFDEALNLIANAPVAQVDAEMEKVKPKKTKAKTEDKKLLQAPKIPKQLPSSKK